MTLRSSGSPIALLVTAALLLPVPVHAQPAAPDAADQSTSPPRLVELVEAAYPPEALAARRGARVELVITIGADGAVADVEVVAAAGDGFDEAAVEAARRFRFEPARTGGVPVAARVRYQYVFALPPVPAAPVTVARGRLEGRILDRARGEPIVGADVRVEDADGGVVARGATDGDGGFGFGELAPGHYRVRVSAFEFGALEADEEVSDGAATSVTYRLDPEPSAGEPEEFGATAVIEAPAREVTTRKLRGAELTKVAGTRGDALRSVELLPGVARPPSGAGVLVVRGSSPWDSGIFLEGADVPLLYHFGGLTSFIPSGLLESIDFHPGNFSVKYGRRIGGVIEVGMRDPRTDRVHALADVNLLDAALQLEGPLARTVSFFAAARRSYMDAWFESVVPAEEIGVTSAPVYWDWQAMVVWKPTERDRVRVSAYGDDDRLELVAKHPDEHMPVMRGRVAAETGFHRGAIAWRHRYSSKVEHDVSLAAGPWYFDFDLGPVLSQQAHATGLYGRAEWRAELAESLRLIGGVDLSHEWGRLVFDGPVYGQNEGNPGQMHDLDNAERTQLDLDFAFFRPAAYVEAAVRPVAGVEIIGGLRSDYYGEIGQLALDPRLVARWSVAPEVVVTGGVGRFTQPPEYGQAVEGLGNPDLEAVSAIHSDVGVEWTPAARTSLGLDGFYKGLDDLVVGGEDGLVNRGEGRIYGLEASARLAPGGRFSGFLSYTLSRSERNDHGMGWRRFDFDQTHILSAAGLVTLGRGWSLGSTVRIVSGSPTTPIADRVYDADADLYRPVFGAVNSERNPLFHQLDLRVEKQWQAGWGRIAAYLDVQNAYNARHVEGETWNYDYTRSAPAYGLPILPSLGLRGEM